MIFKFKKHNADFYSTLLKLSRNLYFYENISLKDTFETRIYLIFFHFSIILIIYKIKKVNFPQVEYDNLFFNIENNLRELGFGDVSVNKKMKDMNKILYDILLKVNSSNENIQINKNLVLKYFPDFKDKNIDKYNYFEQYLINFYNFCFDKDLENMLKETLKFKN
jgi:cytochrome b pre-mRNA-processing protein 3